MIEKKMRYKSAFDIIGPIMVGPSSSHTAGAVRIGKMARELFRCLPEKLVVTFYGSFAETYKGHGTAVAIVAGVLSFDTNDERIPDAIEIAEKLGVTIEFLISKKQTEHANTVNLELKTQKDVLNLTAVSIGGGSIQLTELNHQSTFTESASGHGLVVSTNEPKLAEAQINTALERPIFVRIQDLHNESVIFIETVSEITQNLLEKIKNMSSITTVFSTTG